MKDYKASLTAEELVKFHQNILKYWVSSLMTVKWEAESSGDIRLFNVKLTPISGREDIFRGMFNDKSLKQWGIRFGVI